jgi:hypothetical protein
MSFQNILRQGWMDDTFVKISHRHRKKANVVFLLLLLSFVSNFISRTKWLELSYNLQKYSAIASKDIQNKIDIDDHHCIIIPRKVIGCKFFFSSSLYEIKLTFPFIKMEIIQGQRNKFQPKAAFAYKFKKMLHPVLSRS